MIEAEKLRYARLPLEPTPQDPPLSTGTPS
jgi:hypothetical protein